MHNFALLDENTTSSAVAVIADRTAYDVQLQTVVWNRRGQHEYLLA